MSTPMKSGSPFLGLSPTSETVEGGKQKKAAGTGLYTDATGKTFYVKRAEYVADNIAEVVSSDLLKLVIGEQAVSYEALPNQKDKSIFIASEVSEGFSNLKKHVEKVETQKSKAKKPYSLPMVGANLVFPAVKKTIFNALNPEEKKGLARVLAGCLWVGEYDCQVQNLLIGKDSHGKSMVKKFDNGWGLADICKPGNENVDLSGRKPLYGKSGTHKPSGIPTNHFNDYPDIINSPDFIEALEEVIAAAQPEKIQETVRNSVEQIVKDYSNPDRRLEALRAFAEHMGMPVTKKNVPELKLEISSMLFMRLHARTESLKLLSAELKAKLDTAPPVSSVSFLQRAKSNLTRPLSKNLGDSPKLSKSERPSIPELSDSDLGSSSELESISSSEDLGSNLSASNPIIPLALPEQVPQTVRTDHVATEVAELKKMAKHEPAALTLKALRDKRERLIEPAKAPSLPPRPPSKT